MAYEPTPLQPSQARAGSTLNRNCFANEPAMRIIYPNGASPTTLASDEERVKNDLVNSTDSMFYLAVTPPGEPDTILCYGLYLIVQPNKADSAGYQPSPDANAEAFHFLHAKDAETRGRVLGRFEPYLYLATLCTAPEGRRKGYATKMLSWGKAKGQELGLPVGLVASDEGRFVYLKEGWRTVGHFELDYNIFGLDKVTKNDIMVWTPEGYVEKAE